MQYVFLGNSATLDETEVNRFGAIVELDESYAAAIADRIPIMPLSMLKELFTPAESELACIPDEPKNAAFISKRKAAWDAMHQFRDSLAAKAAKEGE